MLPKPHIHRLNSMVFWARSGFQDNPWSKLKHILERYLTYLKNPKRIYPRAKTATMFNLPCPTKKLHLTLWLLLLSSRLPLDPACTVSEVKHPHNTFHLCHEPTQGSSLFSTPSSGCQQIKQPMPHFTSFNYSTITPIRPAILSMNLPISILKQFRLLAPTILFKRLSEFYSSNGEK